MILAVLAVVVVQQQSPQRSGPAPTPPAVAADTGSLRHAHGRTPPVATAARVAGTPPRLDGRLDDRAWAAAEPITVFTQSRPRDGDPATERTEVRFAYDDEAVYVGARMFDSDPRGVRAQLGRRDASTQSDDFAVAFDSYHDHRTSFLFTVNPLGVKSDQITSNDNSWGDESWDPVWDVATSRDSLGWTVEMRIPFSQLRFPPARTQVWGVNVGRYVQRKDERSLFAWSPQTDRGFASFFGHLFGIADVPQPRRLELLPYTTAREERLDPGATDNPFNDGSVEVASAGLDLKYGLTSNLTLDATFNPDFGQVEADPAVVNLTAFESFFQERRPFFVEGADIFNFAESGGFGGTQFFYSRRAGRAPQGYADPRGGFVDQPANATILGAAKLSGRTSAGWSVGLLEALTAREFATVESAGARFRDEVEPLTNYAVVRAKRDMGGGANTLGFIATAVHRDVDEAALRFLRSAAYAGGVDFTHRFRRNRYALRGSFGYSHIRGDTVAIQAAQRSSARYFQRPDAGYVDYDSTRTTLSGWTGALSAGKEAGLYQFGVSGNATSPGFELNDAGFQTSADDIGLFAFGNRRWPRPGRVFRRAFIGNNIGAEWNFGGIGTGLRYNINSSVQFLNYWGVNFSLNLRFRSLSDRLTRGGPLAVSPAGRGFFFGVSSDYRKRLQAFVGTNYFRDDLGGWIVNVFSEFGFRPTSTLSVSVNPGFFASRSMQQYVRSATDATATATYGRRYVFAEIAQRNLDLTTRLNVTLTPTLSFQFYLQPFVGSGDYRRFRELVAPRTTDFITYGETAGSTLTPHCFGETGTDVDCSAAGAPLPAYFDGDPDGSGPRPSIRIGNSDFSVRSLRGNAVLRWEYRPGSTLFLVWTTSCSAFSSDPQFSAGSDFRHLCQGPSDNVFAVKLNYWLSF
ncbi:MAG: carbohydrate binding family 9 domain-containing protein [Gemmatimonadetes bacterium]|nr:carbohydrate binding family 9 domain-containing protein [Gemmatimonadota bacterium]